jgi:hypothetical protein
MKLTEEERQFFSNISQTETGKLLLSYLAKLKNELFNPQTLTKENFDARKEAFTIIEESLEKPIKVGGKVEKGEANPYQ